MKIEIRISPFHPYQEIERYQGTMPHTGKSGATVSFVGTMRDFNESEQVSDMLLEYYPGMTERHLQSICVEAAKKWDILDVLILHRTGRVYAGEPIVLVSVWATHRADAFSACRHIMEDLKSRAPFWKQETVAGGKRWVEKNTPG
jgi:Molybdopterin converting factor, large subunit